jgi:hypothetical protein
MPFVANILGGPGSFWFPRDLPAAKSASFCFSVHTNDFPVNDDRNTQSCGKFCIHQNHGSQELLLVSHTMQFCACQPPLFWS